MTKTIYAQLRGRFVKNDLFSLKIISSHKGIINLLETEKNLIISLLQDKKNMTGLSLLIPEFFERSHSITDEINLENTQVPGTINIGGYTIEYSETKLWDEPQSSMYNIKQETLPDFSTLLQLIDPGESFLNVLVGIHRNIYHKKAITILSGTVSFSNKVINGLENLIGLGQGMTPSGDDFITGALFAEHCSNVDIKINRQKILNKLQSTTYAGKTLLYLALHNSFPTYLLSFRDELAQSSDLSEKTLKKISEHGSTSGLDTLAGFYWYFKQILTSR